jgi:hypothetical protein
VTDNAGSFAECSDTRKSRLKAVEMKTETPLREAFVDRVVEGEALPGE